MHYAPISAAGQIDGVDMRSTAEVRLSALTDGGQPVDPIQPPLFDIPIAAQQESAASTHPTWPEVDQDVIESIRRQPPQTKRPQTRDTSSSVPASADQSPVRPVPGSPWPPLGASWPAQADPDAPWPGPDANLLPAVVAAQAAPTPTMTEMWAQSSQEVMSRGTVRVCHRCALPVSTQARFCRRCGTRQV
jgi:ribosomal protein L40E